MRTTPSYVPPQRAWLSSLMSGEERQGHGDECLGPLLGREVATVLDGVYLDVLRDRRHGLADQFAERLGAADREHRQRQGLGPPPLILFDGRVDGAIGTEARPKG